MEDNRNTLQHLITLICEDRLEIRMIRSNISSYSATFLSIILGTLAATRGDKAILTLMQSTWLSIGLVIVFSIIAVERYLSLQKIRRYLNYRETIFLGTDNKDSDKYSEDRIRILYPKPEEYKVKKHLNSQFGDKNYLMLILGTVFISSILILVSFFIFR